MQKKDRPNLPEGLRFQLIASENFGLEADDWRGEWSDWAHRKFNLT
jgi:hypothetical protein